MSKTTTFRATIDSRGSINVPTPIQKTGFEKGSVVDVFLQIVEEEETIVVKNKATAET